MLFSHNNPTVILSLTGELKNAVNQKVNLAFNGRLKLHCSACPAPVPGSTSEGVSILPSANYRSLEKTWKRLGKDFKQFVLIKRQFAASAPVMQTELLGWSHQILYLPSVRYCKTGMAPCLV
jgi:hypothetical protein